MADDVAADDDDPIVVVPITDVLDLHTFRPVEIASVVDEYLHAAQAHGWTLVRVIHGKGQGVQCAIVHGVLRRHPAVASFRLADARNGGWGATIVGLLPLAR